VDLSVVATQKALEVLESVVPGILVAVVDFEAVGDRAVSCIPDGPMKLSAFWTSRAGCSRVVAPRSSVVAHAVELVDRMLREGAARCRDDWISHGVTPTQVCVYLSAEIALG
jgi:hypothetical protein